MKNFLIFLSLFLVSLSLSAQSFDSAASSAIPQTVAEVVIKNETGFPLTQMFITKSSTDLWGNEVLKGKAVITPNSSIKISLSISEFDNNYDFKFLDENGNIFVKYEFTVNNSTTLTVYESDSEGSMPSADSITPEEAEIYSTKSALPKKYINGYQQGFLNGYSAGYQAGYEAAKRELSAQNNSEFTY